MPLELTKTKKVLFWTLSFDISYCGVFECMKKIKLFRYLKSKARTMDTALHERLSHFSESTDGKDKN